MSELQAVSRKGRATYYQVRIGSTVHHLGRDAIGARKKFNQLLSKHAATKGNPQTLVGAVDHWSVAHPELDQPWARARLIEWLGDRRIDELAPDLLIRFAEHLGKASTKPRKGHPPHPLLPKTIRHCLAFASRVFRYARDEGWTEVVCRRPKMPRVVLVPRDLAPDDVRRLLDAAPECTKAIIHFLIETGARPSEACTLRWSNVDLPRRAAVLGAHKTAASTGLARTLFLGDGAIALISEQPKKAEHVFLNRRGKPFKASGIRSVLYRLAKALSLSNVTAYALRHTFLQHALDQGQPIEVVAGLAGHRGLGMIRTYARIRDQRLRDAVAGIPSIVPHAASKVG